MTFRRQWRVSVDFGFWIGDFGLNPSHGNRQSKIQNPKSKIPMSQPPSSSEPFIGRFVMRNRRDDVEQAERSVIQAIEQQRFDHSSCFAIRLALEEALSNAFKHGNKNDPGKTVTLECRVGPGVV